MKHSVQDYSPLYNNTFCSIIRDYLHFTHTRLTPTENQINPDLKLD
jgi:hypothetical protein